MHPLGARGHAALLRQGGEAEVAERAAALELVQALARERRAAALLAGRRARRERSNAAAHQHGGKFGHGIHFGASAGSPSPGEKPADTAFFTWIVRIHRYHP